MSKVFFANSGSEANDTQVKLVWYYNNLRGKPRKKKIVSRLGGYHGSTVASASLTGLPMFHRAFDLPIAAACSTRQRRTTIGTRRRGRRRRRTRPRWPTELDALIEREGPDTVAAFIAEPVMGAGGVLVPPRTYFDRVQAVLRKHDVLMIADEVICGFGRLGRLFGSEVYGIEPDLVTVAKGLTSGYFPLSAVDAVRARVVGAPGRIARGRRVRPRLHLQRASGRRGGRDGQPGRPARRGHGRELGPHRRLPPGVSPGASRQSSAGGRHPRPGPDRRRRAGGRPREPPAVRRRAEGRPAGGGPVPRGRADRSRAAGRPRDRAVAAPLHHAGQVDRVVDGLGAGDPRRRRRARRGKARGGPPRAGRPRGGRRGPPRPIPPAGSRCCSSTGPGIGTGPCRRARSSRTSRTRTAPSARLRRRPGSTAFSVPSSGRAATGTGGAGTRPCGTGP